MRNSHTKLARTHRPLPAGSRRVGDVDPSDRIDVTIVLTAPPLPSPDRMPPKALSRADFVKTYGAAASDITKVENCLRSYGLKIEGVGPTRRSLRVSGTAAEMQAAFQAGLGIYESAAQGRFRARVGSVSPPREIAGLVQAVIGLDQRRVARRKTKSAANAVLKRPAARRTAPWTPADIEAHYNFPPGDCAGQKIAIAEFGAPLQSGEFLPPAYFPHDLTAFCKRQGRPKPKIRTVPINLAPLTEAQVRALPALGKKHVVFISTEVMMDIEIIAGLCPAADISVYYATFDQKGWIDLVEKVSGDRPAILSASYGMAEDSPDWEPAAIHAINQALQAAAMLGITICVASGDDGSGCNMTDDRFHIEFPGSSPFVLAVGGTMLAPHEVVWWQSPGRRTLKESGSTGGGVSAIFRRPRWQTARIASLNPVSIAGRIVPDVAALAGPPLYSLILNGKHDHSGGTSASTPVWAALLARINAALPAARRRRFIPPLLYQDNVGTQAFTDIVAGENASHPNPGKGYPAGPGFDAVSGWGVPDGKKLLSLL